MKKRPELMILIAVIAALVVSLLCSAISCSMVMNAVNHPAQQAENFDEWINDHINGGDNGGNEGDSQNGGDSQPGNGGYTDQDVPASMEIEVDELSDDLQAVINSDITRKLGLSDTDKVTVSNLTKETVATPELKNGYVLSQVSGKVTITNMLGNDETVDYTSYYYADNPRASKITWYIYAYDLSSYKVLPNGFEEIAGDPMNVRGIIQGDASLLGDLLGASEGDTQHT
ncbi:MAG: hypothetical protein Q4C36_05385 [Coriobacteriia bacterium]|nr:hypothetical protein [Coriobacteriia bacterium]